MRRPVATGQCFSGTVKIGAGEKGAALQLILVSGYSRGIGAAISAELLNRREQGALGARFVFIGRKPPQAAIFASRIAGEDHFLEWDLAQPSSASCRSELSALLEASASGGVGLIYAAGLLGPIGQAASRQGWEDAWSVNVSGFAELAGHVVSLEGAGHLVLHLSSGAALSAYADLACYCSTKAASLMWSRCLSERVTHDRCAVLSVAPGTVKSDMTDTLANSDPSACPGLEKFRTLGREGGFVDATPVAQSLVAICFDKAFSELRGEMHGKYYDLRQPGKFL